MDSLDLQTVEKEIQLGITNEDNLYDSIFQLEQFFKSHSIFKIGYIILQYMIDPSQISNLELKKILETYLSEIRNDFSCETVEQYLDRLGLKVVDLWSEGKRREILWLENKGYLQGLLDVTEKIGGIKSVVEEAGKNVPESILEKFDLLTKEATDFGGAISGSVGGVVKELVGSAIKAIALNQITKVMLADYSRKIETPNDPEDFKEKFYQKRLAQKLGLKNLNEGIGILEGSFCQEIKVNTGFKYLDLIKLKKIKQD